WGDKPIGDFATWRSSGPLVHSNRPPFCLLVTSGSLGAFAGREVVRFAAVSMALVHGLHPAGIWRSALASAALALVGTRPAPTVLRSLLARCVYASPKCSAECYGRREHHL